MVSSPIEWQFSDQTVPYQDAINQMETRVHNIIAGTVPEMVWLLEHPPLYTAGTSANAQDLLDDNRFDVFKTGRGGEYTYHGPGQRIGYVMLNLKQRQQQDIKHYVHQLEQWLINTLAHFAIKGERREGRVGIWVDMGYGKEAKIGAIGVRVRKWVTYHGIALNIEPDLEHFSGIVPCGISEHGITSFADLGHMVTIQEVDHVLQHQFSQLFE